MGFLRFIFVLLLLHVYDELSYFKKKFNVYVQCLYIPEREQKSLRNKAREGKKNPSMGAFV